MVFNIHDSSNIIELPVGIFSIKVLGGWGVRVGVFSIILKNIVTNQVILPKPAIFRLQSFEYGQRAIKIMSIDISERGKFKVQFKNQNYLIVKHSNLLLSKLFFEKEIPNRSLQICIK